MLYLVSDPRYRQYLSGKPSRSKKQEQPKKEEEPKKEA